jgi:hypothetical protein
MIAIRLNGRLGNQLFQYAFIYTAAKELNTSFFIDQYHEKFIAGNYFENLTPNRSKLITRLFYIEGFKNIFSFHLRRFYYDFIYRFYKVSVKEYDFNCDSSEITFRNKTLYSGYFQSELFFKAFEKSIRDKFILKKKFSDQFNLKYNELYKNNKIVTVHIRRTDYLHLPHLNLGGADLSLPIAYYKNAISRYAGQKVHFVFISDDNNFIQENFKEILNKTISMDSEIMDFQHLLNADGCILSNSTFSWWGAWLNNKTEKNIYAPKYFMGWRIKKETPACIYPDNWILIDF